MFLTKLIVDAPYTQYKILIFVHSYVLGICAQVQPKHDQFNMKMRTKIVSRVLLLSR